MAVELKFSKADNTPWGFRLVGGADFDTPLTVVKVTEGSLAEEAGMRIGDTVVRVNDVPTSSLTHSQAHDLIKEAGNNFVLAVFRGVVGEPVPEPKPLSVQPLGSTASISQTESQTDQTLEPGEPPVLEIALPPTAENLSEEDWEMAKINESAETNKIHEFIQEHNLEQHSEVMQTKTLSATSDATEVSTSTPTKFVQLEYSVKMEDESTQSIKDKKWSTFLQKPKNPKPKPKKEEDERPKDAPYRVVINKIKRRLSRDFIHETVNPPSTKSESDVSEAENKNNLAAEVGEIREERTEEHSEVSTEEHREVNVTSETSEVVEKSETSEVNVNKSETQMSYEASSVTEVHQESKQIKEESSISMLQLPQIPSLISETNLSKEEQLALVQKQLLALSQLPAAIQVTLNAVTEQLAKIVSKKDENEDQNDGANEDKSTHEDGTDVEGKEKEGEEGEQQDENTENLDVDGEEKAPSIVVDTLEGDHTDGQSTKEPTPAPTPTPEPEDLLSREEREALDKKHKAQQMLAQKEEERQILEIQQKKSNVKSHFPSTPMQRPIILPGGRKWFDPDDVVPRKINERKYTDEVIAETISSQSELIMGRALGESNCHMVPSKAAQSKRVNFLKYKPDPPKSMDHLKHSEVYKMVHSLDLPTRGIAGRPSLVVAEEDVTPVQSRTKEGGNGMQTQPNLPAQMEP